MSEDKQEVKYLYHYTQGDHSLELEVHRVRRVTESVNYRLASGELVQHDADSVDPKLDDWCRGDVWLTRRDDNYARARMRKVCETELEYLAKRMAEQRNRLLLCDQPVVEVSMP